MVSNLHFHDREFCVPVAHPEVVALPYPGMPWKLSETPGEWVEGIAADVPPTIPPPFIIHGR